MSRHHVMETRVIISTNNSTSTDTIEILIIYFFVIDKDNN